MKKYIALFLAVSFVLTFSGCERLSKNIDLISQIINSLTIGSASAGGAEDWVCGTWFCETEYQDGLLAHFIEITEDGIIEYSCGYANSEVICHFSGTWANNGDGSISIDMMGGDIIWNDDSVEFDTSVHFDGVYEWSFNNGNNLVLNYISGDKLIGADSYDSYTLNPFDENAVG